MIEIKNEGLKMKIQLLNIGHAIGLIIVSYKLSGKNLKSKAH